MGHFTSDNILAIQKKSISFRMISFRLGAASWPGHSASRVSSASLPLRQTARLFSLFAIRDLDPEPRPLHGSVEAKRRRSSRRRSVPNRCRSVRQGGSRRTARGRRPPVPFGQNLTSTPLSARTVTSRLSRLERPRSDFGQSPDLLMALLTNCSSLVSSPAQVPCQKPVSWSSVISSTSAEIALATTSSSKFLDPPGSVAPKRCACRRHARPPRRRARTSALARLARAGRPAARQVQEPPRGSRSLLRTTAPSSAVRRGAERGI